VRKPGPLPMNSGKGRTEEGHAVEPRVGAAGLVCWESKSPSVNPLPRPAYGKVGAGTGLGLVRLLVSNASTSTKSNIKNAGTKRNCPLRKGM
jgi:hypothetical protein